MKSTRKSKKKQPWPTLKVMQQIYNLHLWGGTSHDFYSGEGSHHPNLVEPYLETITLFLTSFETPLTVCDLGCGDFNIGKALAPYTEHYYAIDIVPELIERNNRLFKNTNLEFLCLNIAEDDLPIADCVIVRQVLQHLSNAEIEKIAQKLNKFKYILITEHLPTTDFVPNKDIVSGQGNRMKKRSGVDLLAPPFDFQAKKVQELLSINLTTSKKDQAGKIVTTLFQTF